MTHPPGTALHRQRIETRAIRRHTSKVLGQDDPDAATDTDLYTVPKKTEVERVVIYAANRGAATTIRVAIRPDGATIANAHYLSYDDTLPANKTAKWDGIELNADDVITVRNTDARVTFSAFGREAEIE